MMRNVIAIWGMVVAALAGAARADEIPVTSRIESVTVFPAGAEAMRAARLTLAKGEHTLVFSDLPAEAVPGSIRVDGKATAGLDIQSVDTRRRYIPRADQEALQAERKGIEDEIEKLRDERGLLQGQEDAAQTQKTLLQNLAQMPGRPQPEEGQPVAPAQAVPATDWTQILSLIASGMTEAQRLALDAEVKKRDLDRHIEELEKKLGALAPGRNEQTEVKVFVVAGAPLDADLTVRYQVRNASWTPRYDARLVTGSKTVPPLLELARRADIVQRTGESSRCCYRPRGRPPMPPRRSSIPSPSISNPRCARCRRQRPRPRRHPWQTSTVSACARNPSARRSWPTSARPRSRPSTWSSKAPVSPLHPSRLCSPFPGASRCRRPARASASFCSRMGSSRCSPFAPCPNSTPRPTSMRG
jgi:hypothetical protein